jgi:hypothetical protein
MKKAVIAAIFILISYQLLGSQDKPSLVFDGVNGYPGTGDSTYKIEIFVAKNGFISGIKSFINGSSNANETTSVVWNNKTIAGECRSEGSRTVFKFDLSGNKISRHITIYDTEKNSIFSEKESIVLIYPSKDTLFETDKRRFVQANPGELIIVDSITNEQLFVFRKNQILYDGWYRSDWKAVGGKISVYEYQTMEKNADWINAGHGYFTGKAFFNSDQTINVLNFCILDIVYLDSPIFLPFIFGLKTGSY